MTEFLAAMGDDARRRPEPTLRGSVVAAAAVLAVAGLLAFALDAQDGDRVNVLGVVLGLFAAGAGHGALVTLPASVRPAGITAVVLGTLMVIAFVFQDVDAASLPLFVAIVAFGVQWVAGPARGASTLLTLTLLGIWAFLLDAVAGDPSGPANAVTFDEVGVPGSDTVLGGDDAVSYLSLFMGIVLLSGVRALDRRGFRGTATSLVIVGDVAFVAGVLGVAGTFDGDTAAAFLVLVGSLVLAFVGAGGGRRFTTWLGGLGVLAGLVGLLSTAANPDSATQFGAIALIFGAGIVTVAAFVPTEEPPGSTDPTPSPDGPGEPCASHDATPEVRPEAQGWHPDPTGRHDLRWHDGAAWTPHVSDEGRTSTDEGV